MVGPVVRIVAQALVGGGVILAKAFAEAYQKALINAAKNGGAAQAPGTNATARAIKGLTEQEAIRILGVQETTSIQDILAKATKMYDNNAKDKGGSVYIQSKVLNAQNALEAFRRDEDKDKEPPNKPEAGN